MPPPAHQQPARPSCAAPREIASFAAAPGLHLVSAVRCVDQLVRAAQRFEEALLPCRDASTGPAVTQRDVLHSTWCRIERAVACLLREIGTS